MEETNGSVKRVAALLTYIPSRGDEIRSDYWGSSGGGGVGEGGAALAKWLNDPLLMGGSY